MSGVGGIIITPFCGYMVTFYNICISSFLNNSEKSICKTSCNSHCPIGHWELHVEYKFISGVESLIMAYV